MLNRCCLAMNSVHWALQNHSTIPQKGNLTCDTYALEHASNAFRQEPCPWHLQDVIVTLTRQILMPSSPGLHVYMCNLQLPNLDIFSIFIIICLVLGSAVGKAG